MATAHVISFGETMLRFTPPTGTRLEQAELFSAYVAGAESNALACLARLGLHATWISALPSNALGRVVEAALRSHGVDLSKVVWRSEGERLGIFYAEESPAPIGTRVHYDRAGSACARIDLGSVDFAGLNDAQLLYLTGITPALGERASAVFTHLLQFAEESGIPLAFDVNYRARLWSPSEASEGIEAACREASVIICTRDDAAALWGFTGEAEAVLRRISSRFGEADRTLVLTLGSEGAAELKSGDYSCQAAMPAEGSYRFGSGDAFAAGYMYAHLGGEHYRNLKEEVGATPLQYGNALAALKRGIAGDIAVVTPYDVKAAIVGRGRFR